MLVLCVFIYHIVVNVITIVRIIVKLAKSHYLLLSFVCLLYIVFVCLFV